MGAIIEGMLIGIGLITIGGWLYEIVDKYFRTKYER